MDVAEGRVDLSEVLQGLERHQAKIESRIRQLSLQLEETRLLYKRVERLKDADVAPEIGGAQIELLGDLSPNHTVDVSPLSTQMNTASSRSTGATSQKPKIYEKDRVIDHARDVLNTAVKPLDRAELLEAFIERGYTPDVKDKPKFIGKTLWASDEFVHAAGMDAGGYWLASRKLPDGYHADERDGAGGAGS